MNLKYLALYLIVAAAGVLPPVHAQAQTTTSCTSTNLTENFTGASTGCTWNWVGGACLTAAPASTASLIATPGPLPQCVGSVYYGSQTQIGGNSGNLNTTPDTPTTGGALRLTNAAGNQAGAIISNTPFNLAANGLSVQFTTETYAGDNNGGHGADGIGFFLQDASAPVNYGDYGGSLGYTCSDQNNSPSQGYDGITGGYIGLGIDEWGNFLNGTTIASFNATTGVTTYTQSTGADNTSSGYGYVPNRIGLRGPGSTNWASLNTLKDSAGNPLNYYPSTLNSSQQRAAVRQACQTGMAWDYSGVSNTASAGSGTTNGFPNPYSSVATTVALPNYAAIPNAYTVLTAHKIATEGATILRGYATTGTTGAAYGTPITYNLTITNSSTPLLSLSYSYGGGNFLPIITGQALPSSLPAQVRFGFSGSTGGSTNIHEIMCFQAAPQNAAASSAGLNQKQTAKVQSGTQVYFAFYNAANWSGELTSQYLDSPDGNPNDLQIDPAVNWSASCNLTGGTGTCGKTGQPLLAAPNPDSGRTMLTYNGTAGVPFTWGNLTSGTVSQQTNMDYGDLPPASGGPAVTARVEYLRGFRGDEQTPQGVDPLTPTVNPSGMRVRTSILGDIIDSSPTWVGPPQVSFPTTWSDMLNSAVTMPENSASYTGFQSTYGTRTNVVYAGSNDGFLHGFRTGSFTAALNGTFVNTNNDGAEVLAFMPAYIVNTINSSTLSNTLPVTPNYANDYTNPLYGHKFNVDGTPGTGDLFYAGAWHSWLVGGLGAGGSSIYALDITDPSLFSQSNAASLVIGEWSSALTTTTTGTPGAATTTVTGSTATFTCANTPTTPCGNSLGRTYGTPQIRRFHNDPSVSGSPNTSWGVVFGNGSNSYTDDAGIFIMMVNTNSADTALASPTFYYLSTGVGSRTGTPNGIYYVTPVDLDGDHVTDYVYAGDLQGNIWKFDLTNKDPSQWSVTKVSGTPQPIYSTCASTSACTASPITTQLLVASIAAAPYPRVLVEFGTGKQVQATQNASATYQGSAQSLIGVWDWNMSSWNALSAIKYAIGSALTGTAPSNSCFSGAALCGTGSLQAQSITGPYTQSGSLTLQTDQTANGAYFRTVSSAAVCWGDLSTCSSTKTYGWYLPLTSGYGNQYDANLPLTNNPGGGTQVYEQTIYSPVLQDGAFIINTTIPPTSSVATCSSSPAGGWTMALNPATGGAFTNSFFADSSHNFLNIQGQAVSGIALNGTGSPSVVTQGTNVYAVTQTINGAGAIVQVNPPGGTQGSRLTWIQKR